MCMYFYGAFDTDIIFQKMKVTKLKVKWDVINTSVIIGPLSRKVQVTLDKKCL